MRLKEYCAKVENRLKNDLITESNWGNDSLIIQEIRNRINKHHVAMNPLRTFAAIYLFQNARQRGITIDQLNAILGEDDVVTAEDVILGVNRLQSVGIIKFDGRLYSLITTS